MSAGVAIDRVTRNHWPARALVMMGVGLAMLGMPASIEGPVILPISPGHALSVLDAIGVLPLLTGSFSLYRGLWQRRGSLRAVALRVPGPAGGLVFVGGFGRGRGYAKQALKKMLAHAAAEGLRYVEITTRVDNEPSQRVILANGGVLDEEFTAPAALGGHRHLRYRVQLAPGGVACD